MVARTSPRQTPLCLKGSAVDEVMAALALPPVTETSLRARVHEEVFATEASPSRAGACWCDMGLDLALKLYLAAEEKGAYARLDRALPEHVVRLRD